MMDELAPKPSGQMGGHSRLVGQSQPAGRLPQQDHDPAAALLAGGLGVDREAVRLAWSATRRRCGCESNASFRNALHRTKRGLRPAAPPA
jgi:hypothetical protein